jgi:hypothetical protein
MPNKNRNVSPRIQSDRAAISLSDPYILTDVAGTSHEEQSDAFTFFSGHQKNGARIDVASMPLVDSEPDPYCSLHATTARPDHLTSQEKMDEQSESILSRTFPFFL